MWTLFLCGLEMINNADKDNSTFINLVLVKTIDKGSLLYYQVSTWNSPEEEMTGSVKYFK